MIKALKCAVAVFLDLFILVMLCISIVIAFVPIAILTIFFGLLFIVGFVWGWSHDVETEKFDYER
jgi:thiamine transporter ThiT